MQNFLVLTSKKTKRERLFFSVAGFLAEKKVWDAMWLWLCWGWGVRVSLARLT